jgi:hypothetical protein
MKFYFFTSLLIFSSICSAAASNDKQPIQLSIAAGNLSQQRLEINQKLSLPNYSELSQDNRVELNQLLDSLVADQLLGSEAIIGQDKINNILKQTFADSKLVCKLEAEIGSNMKKKVCQTVAAKRRAYEQTQIDGVNVKQ